VPLRFLDGITPRDGLPRLILLVLSDWCPRTYNKWPGIPLSDIQSSIYNSQKGNPNRPAREPAKDESEGFMKRGRQQIKILFLCTENSCRSQMAEGWARALKGDIIEPYSAGVEARGLDPRAVKVMFEAGVDISSHRSKHVGELVGMDFDLVITVCDNTHEICPVFPGKTRVVHRGFDDPPRLAREATTDDEALAHYRRVRDEIKAFVEKLPDEFARFEAE